MRRSDLTWLLPLALVACDPVARGDAAWEESRLEDAVAAWSESETLDAAHQGRMARALVRLGRYDDAAVWIDGLPVAERTGDGHLAAGLLLLYLHDLPAAAEAFGAGLETEALPELVVNHCTALAQLGDPGAKGACQAAVESQPEDPRPFLGLATATAPDLSEASREALGMAIARLGARGDATRTALAPWISGLWLALGEADAACTWALEAGLGDLATARSCLSAGRRAEARPMLQALSEGEGSRVPLRLLVQLDLDLAERAQPGPERERGLASLERWVTRLEGGIEAGTDPGWENDLGRLAWLRQQAPVAEVHWTRALELAPDQAPPRLNLAKALDRRGRTEQARALLEAAAGAGTEPPGLYAVQLALVDLEQKAGEIAAARTRLEGVHAACSEEALASCAARAALLLSRIEAQAGELDRSLGHLEQALTYGGPALAADVRRDPAFEPLRADLRFHELLGAP